MQNEELKSLLNFIKTDNDTEFTTLIEKYRAYNITLGKFPLLSLMYLYNSKKLLKHYAKRLHNIKEYEIKQEQNEIYLDFKHLAKRCLRLFLSNDIVTAFDILLLQGDTTEFLKYFKKENFDENQLKRFDNINKILTGNTIQYSSNKIILPKRVLVGKRKAIIKYSFVVVCFVLVLSLSSAIYSLVYAKSLQNGIFISNQNMLNSSLTLKGEYDYYIEKDFTINLSSWKTQNLDKKIDGKNHTITLTNVTKPLFDTINTDISNINFVIKDEKISSNLFNTNKANISNCNFEFSNFSVEYTGNFSLICSYNFGNIQNSNIIANGKMKAVNDSNQDNTTKYIQILTEENYGLIENITLKEDIEISGLNFIDYEFSNICGKNFSYKYYIYTVYSQIKNITIKESKIKSNQIDLCGICAENNAVIENLVIDLDIENTNNDTKWNPNVSGVSISNNYKIDNVTLNGKITITTKTTEGSLFGAGIAILNYGAIEDCNSKITLTGTIEVTNSNNIYLGGICINNYASIEYCKFDGTITSTSKSAINYLGGISAVNLYYLYTPASISNCIANGKIVLVKENLTETENVLGGICGFNMYGINSCVSFINFEYTNCEKTFVGMIAGTLAKGEYTQEMIDSYLVSNMYLKQNDLYGICGYYEDDLHTKATKDLTNMSCYILKDDIIALFDSSMKTLWEK